MSKLSEIEQASVDSAMNMGAAQDMFHPDYGWVLRNGEITEIGMEFFKKIERDKRMSKEQHFIDLAKRMEDLTDEMNELRESLNEAMHALGYDSYAQDPVSLLVYKIIKPLGTFTYYRDIDYKRTVKVGERGGTVLSKSEAEKAGFKLE